MAKLDSRCDQAMLSCLFGQPRLSGPPFSPSFLGESLIVKEKSMFASDIGDKATH